MATDLMQLRVDKCLINGTEVQCTDFRVEKNTEWIEVGDSSAPDHKWTFTDAAGHFHAYDKDGNTPTLEWQTTRSWYCDDCRDTHEDQKQACLLCGEFVKPDSVSVWNQRIAGPSTVTYTVDVVGDVPSDGMVNVFVKLEAAEWFGILSSVQSHFKAGNELSRTTYSGTLFQRMKLR